MGESLKGFRSLGGLTWGCHSADSVVTGSHCSIWFIVSSFRYSLCCLGSVRQIKLTTRRLFGARTYSLSYRALSCRRPIVSYRRQSASRSKHHHACKQHVQNTIIIISKEQNDTNYTPKSQTSYLRNVHCVIMILLERYLVLMTVPPL